MKTKRWDLKNETMNNSEAIAEAVELIIAGETVAFPTETVYGLGADATNEEAVSKIFAAKERPEDNPLIAHVANIDQLKNLVDNPPKYVEKLMERFSPGPLTFVLPSNGTCASNVTAGLTTVAVRIPDHPVALEILEKAGRPVAAPSANLSGKPSPTTADHVWEDLQGKIAGVIDAGPTGVGVESTVIACRANDVVILRPGGITKEEIQEIVPVTENRDSLEDKPVSPGMKYKHYAPEAPLWLVKGGVEEMQDLITQEREKGQRVAFLGSEKMSGQLKADQNVSLGESDSEVASNLYHGLRSVKTNEIDLIVAESFTSEGMGEAVMNRLRKAAVNFLDLSN